MFFGQVSAWGVKGTVVLVRPVVLYTAAILAGTAAGLAAGVVGVVGMKYLKDQDRLDDKTARK